MPEYHFTDEEIGFEILDNTMVELGKDNLADSWPFEDFPRIIKTHLPYQFFFKGYKAILILRNPYDALVSFFKFETGKTTPRFNGLFSEFIRHPRFGIHGWCRHYLSWKNKAGLIIKYEDMKVDEINQFQKLNSYLDITVDENLFKKAIELSSFNTIKQLEETKGLSNPSRFGSNFKFTRSSETGQWKNIFSEKDLEYVNDTLKNYSIDVYSFA